MTPPDQKLTRIDTRSRRGSRFLAYSEPQATGVP